MLSRSERLKRARITLQHGGTIDPHLIAPHISDSWNRCLELGLDPMGTAHNAQLTARELRDQRDEDELVHRFAASQMQALYQQIAGSNFMIAFGNTRGTVLETVSDGAFRSSKAGKAILPGSVWLEELRGTNAMGTAAAIRQPLIVHGEEHFFHTHSDVSCFAAPVFHSNGDLAGVLDASSDCRARNRHTLVLMQMAATHIENSLFLRQQEDHMVLLFQSRFELLNSVSGGLMSFDSEGRLRAINQRGRSMLSGLNVRPGTEFEAIFDTSFANAVSHLGNSLAPSLTDLFGSQYAVQLSGRLITDGRTRSTGGNTSVASPPVCVTSFVANDPVLQRELLKVQRAVSRKPPFLILGESGTGKEIFARHIHAASDRKGAFVPVNCGALPEQLFEAELFGYAQGAFTGARKDGAIGLARAADGGTLFLDEIGDLALQSQVALLRFLDQFEVRPVGGTNTHKVDVQIVGATNVDLLSAIAEKRFRSDLFYRLGVVQLNLPPLRERHDFPEVTRFMLGELDHSLEVTNGAIDCLAQRDWPGNLRELRSALFQLSLVIAEGPIDIDHVEQVFGSLSGSRRLESVGLRGVIIRQVNELLRTNGNNVSETAKTLGISRNTVYKYSRRNLN